MRALYPTALLALTAGATLAPALGWRRAWSADERREIAALSLSALPALPDDPSNRVANDSAAAELGHALFFETRLSANGRVSCATCHLPDREFQDGRPLGIGIDTAGRRTQPIAATAHAAWFFWDGRADSQWAQALGPIENAAEHGADRLMLAHVVARHHRAHYERVFGALPPLDGLPDAAGPVDDPGRRAAWDRLPAARRKAITGVFVNAGKAIAAFERGIMYAPSRFDRYADAVAAGRRPSADAALSVDEEAGLALFIGKASCTQCHNGPLLTDGHFHNIATQVGPADSGRVAGVRLALASDFNCAGPWSDAPAQACSELRFVDADTPELVGAFKTPSLRGIAERAPYFHAGQAATLRAALEHYARPPRALLGTSELERVRLSRREVAQLEAFLRTLSAPHAAPPGHLRPPEPSSRTAQP